jgi:hypothetical protein
MLKPLPLPNPEPMLEPPPKPVGIEKEGMLNEGKLNCG